MSGMQITICGPHVKVATVSPSCCLSASRLCFAPTSAINLPLISSKLKCYALRYQTCNPICLFGGKDKPENDEASPWKSLENAIGGLGGLKKELTVQDVVREQMRREELGDYGGDGGRPPGGSGDGSRGSDGSADEDGGPLGELLQVVLATIGFLSVYIYILHGAELSRLFKDFIRYLFNGKKSVRLTKAMDESESLYDYLTRKKVAQNLALEHVIMKTRTLFDKPRKFKKARPAKNARRRKNLRPAMYE